MTHELKIDKESFTGSIDGRPLKRNERIHLICTLCGNDYETSLAGEENKKRKTSPWACKSCCLRKRFSTRKSADVSRGVVLNRSDPCQSTDVEGNLLGYYQKFSTECQNCSNSYETCVAGEASKKHRWFCASCAIKDEWTQPEYRSLHEETLRAAANRPETWEVKRQNSIRMWNNPEIRERITSKAKIARATPEWKKAASDRMHQWWLSNAGRNSFKDKHQADYYSQLMGFSVWLRSSYERRFAEWLDTHQIRWLYEHKAFDLLVANRQTVYVPDFYLPEKDLYVEVKGFFYPDARAKWEAFVVQCQIPKLLIMKEQLIQLESGFSIEDLID